MSSMLSSVRVRTYSSFTTVRPTPNILTEASHLLGQFDDHGGARTQLAQQIATLSKEHYVASHACAESNLSMYLAEQQLDVINFNHIRPS
jgi:hypothetical protein